MDNKITQTKYEYNKCNYTGCLKYGSFNNIRNNKGLYCKTHKQENMIDVKSKLCVFNGCEKYARYNSYDKKELFCKTHKQENMIMLAIMLHADPASDNLQ